MTVFPKTMCGDVYIRTSPPPRGHIPTGKWEQVRGCSGNKWGQTLKDKLSTGQAKRESGLWRTLAFEQASREAFDTFAATVEHAVARFNKRFSRSQKIKLEFGRILDGFVLKKEFAPSALAEIRLNPSNETVQFNITRHSSTQVFTKALKFDTSDRICFEQASGLLSVDDAAIALFHYVSDTESNLSRWFDRPNGSKSRAAAN